MKKIILVFISLLVLCPFKINAVTTNASSHILMDQKSKLVLDGKNIHEKRLIASITKIMTAIVTLENVDIKKEVTINESILKSYGSNIYIEVGEKITVENLLYGLMLRSGNDAAIALADYVFGYDKFIEKMNDKALELNMKNTIFKNPHGLDQETENYSTAYDMALLTSYAMDNENYRKITKTKKKVVKTNYKTYVWQNKNKMLKKYKNSTGGKTGFTNKARRTLVSTANNDDFNLVVVTLNDSSDWNDHIKLFEYGYQNYYSNNILKKESFGIYESFYKGKLYIKNDFSYPILKKSNQQLYTKIELEKNKNYKDEDLVGFANIYLGNKNIHKEKIYVRKESKKVKKSIWRIIKSWFKW